MTTKIKILDIRTLAVTSETEAEINDEMEIVHAMDADDISDGSLIELPDGKRYEVGTHSYEGGDGTPVEDGAPVTCWAKLTLFAPGAFALVRIPNDVDKSLTLGTWVRPTADVGPNEEVIRLFPTEAEAWTAKRRLTHAEYLESEFAR